MGETVQCPGCGRDYPLNATLLGRVVQCRTCGQAFRINPVVEAESVKPEVATPPKPSAAPPPSRVTPPQRAVPPQPRRGRPADETPAKEEEYAEQREDEEEEEDDDSEGSVRVPSLVYEDISALQSNWEVAVRKLNFRSPDDVANFLVGHKLMLAVISVAFLSLIIFTQVGAGAYGFVLFVMGLALTPFGLLPVPQSNESRSGFYFAFVALVWLAIALLLRAINGELLPAMDGLSAPMVLGVYVFLIVGILASAGGIVAVSLLFRRFGFFRAGAWLYMIGLVLLPLVWSSCPQSLKDNMSPMALIRGGGGAGPGGIPFGPGVHPLASNPQMLSLAQHHGLNRVVTLELEGLPADKAEAVLARLKTKIKGGEGFVGPTTGTSTLVVVAPWGQPQSLANKIDFGTVTKVDSDLRILSIRADLSKLAPTAKPVVAAASPTPSGPAPSGPAAGPPDNLADLKGTDPQRQREAVARLKQTAPKEQRQETTQALLDLLATTQGPNRIAILDTLDVVGGDQLVPTFIDLLKDKDPEFRKKVLDILVRRGDPRSIVPMVRLLAQADSGADEALVRMGPAAELGVLDLLGELDESASVRACHVLARIGSDRSLPALKQLARHSNPAVSSAATEAIQAISRRIDGGASMPSPTPSKMERPAEKAKPPAPATESLPAPVKPPEVSPPGPPVLAGKDQLDNAIAALGRADPERKVAGQQLRRMSPDKARGREVADALVKALGETQDAETRVSLIEALATWYTPETLPVLFEGLRNDNLFVRHKTIEALGTVRDEGAIRILAECLGDAALSVPAAQALSAIGPTAEKTMLKYAEHPNPQVRLQAVRVLGQIGTERSMSTLTRMGRTNDAMLRWAVDDAMQSIRERRSDRGAVPEGKPRDSKDLDVPGVKRVD